MSAVKPKEATVRAFWMASLFLVLLSCVLVFILPVRQAWSDQKAEEVLTNETVVDMTRAGFDAAVIVAKIQSTKSAFDVSLDALLLLKKENVADDVVKAMIQATKGESANTPSQIDPNDPTTPHEPGIYLMKEQNGKRVMIKIDPTVYSETKSGGFFSRLESSATYGITKTKSKAIIIGAHARVQIESPRPVFYFYFGQTKTKLSNTGNTFQSAPAASPNEFVIVKMKGKKESRELVVGQFNIYGSQSGIPDKNVQPFDYKRLASGIFKVTPKNDLKKGEYCFSYAGTAPLSAYGWGMTTGSQQVFAFGIKAAAKK